MRILTIAALSIPLLLQATPNSLVPSGKSPRNNTIPTPSVSYTFEQGQPQDDQKLYMGTLENDASIVNICDNHVLYTGSRNGFMDMGEKMGKSVFARAFIQALTGAEEVPSPTFTLLQTYDAPEFEIYHYDLYRLKSPEEVFELNIEEAIYGGVCLIEWPEKMGGYLPRQALKINIAPENNGRRLTLDCADNRRLSRFNDVKAGND